jgi:chaperonin GroEL
LRARFTAPVARSPERGHEGKVVAIEVAKTTGSNGFNAATGKYEDLVKAGIIDPALVSKTALTNAASVAGLMLTTDVLVTELKEDAEPATGSVN